jgi:hypothetical protein
VDAWDTRRVVGVWMVDGDVVLAGTTGRRRRGRMTECSVTGMATPTRASDKPSRRLGAAGGRGRPTYVVRRDILIRARKTAKREKTKAEPQKQRQSRQRDRAAIFCRSGADVAPSRILAKLLLYQL